MAWSGVSLAIGGSTPKASAVSITMLLGTGPRLASEQFGMKSIG
jgi:hypothetical protein